MRHVTYRMADVAVAMLVFAMALAVMIGSYELGIGWSDDSPGSGYFPFRIGVIIALASIGIAVQAWRSQRPRADDIFVTWARFKFVLTILLPTAVYILGISFVGIYVSSFVFIATFMHFAGKFDWLKATAVSGGTVIVLFWLFELEFLVPLPKGPLEALLGY